jgi:GTP-binding protein
MFIDETTIMVKAGNGGNGCFAYLREKYRPKGGPSGGSGGRGGNIYICGSHHLRTLQDLHYRGHYRADSGANGRGGNKDGKDADDVTLLVPLGTVVFDADTNDLLFDALDDKETFCAACGGAGGRGNAALKTRSNPLPDHAEKGKPGQERRLRLELKVLADVGLVGRPNSGKSTFLSRISSAKPKIAEYPFTTTQPYLGIVRCEGYQSFVVADIPGLIEGSHVGKGLGIRFLRHIERTRVLAILVPADSPDPQAEASLLLGELSAYSPYLSRKPACFILSKSDLARGNNQPSLPGGWLSMSSVTGMGVEAVLLRLKQMLDADVVTAQPSDELDKRP